MGEVIMKSAVNRKIGYMYYVDGHGNLCKAETGSFMKKSSSVPKTSEKKLYFSDIIKLLPEKNSILSEPIPYGKVGGSTDKFFKKVSDYFKNKRNERAAIYIQKSGGYQKYDYGIFYGLADRDQDTQETIELLKNKGLIHFSSGSYAQLDKMMEAITEKHNDNQLLDQELILIEEMVNYKAHSSPPVKWFIDFYASKK